MFSYAARSENRTLFLERPCIGDRGRAQIFRKKIEIRSWNLHQPKRLVRPVQEPISTHITRVSRSYPELTDGSVTL